MWGRMLLGGGLKKKKFALVRERKESREKSFMG